MTPANNYPRICLEAGLTCDSCVAETARQVAAVCKGLRGKMIGQLFVQIHAHAACSPMHKQFAEHSHEASREITPLTMAAAVA